MDTTLRGAAAVGLFLAKRARFALLTLAAIAAAKGAGAAFLERPEPPTSVVARLG